LQGFFCNIPDPRVERTRAHHLTDVLMIAILAVTAGAKGWEDIENYGDRKLPWLEQFLELPGGIPCADTFRRVFERIDPVAFEQSFRDWVQALVTSLGAQVIAIDGKTLKGSYGRPTRTSALQMVSAWASEHRLVLGQLKVTDQGQRLKVAIARALVHAPGNLLLDEPTNGLDVMSTRALRQVLRRLRDEGCCVLFSSHIMQEIAALCDRIVIIADGAVAAEGTAEQLRAATGKASLEDAFVAVIGSEEGLLL
jgi:ABC-type uncharacterized transport system YnjBCD ATPase subunit